MKLFVKHLHGDGFTLEVEESTKISEVKKQIEVKLKIPISQQTLISVGKTLSDDQTVGSYPRIKDGSKVHVMVKKSEPLHCVLTRFLQKYYTEKQAELITLEFMKDFHTKVRNLSLDDLERMATLYLSEEGNI